MATSDINIELKEKATHLLVTDTAFIEGKKSANYKLHSKDLDKLNLVKIIYGGKAVGTSVL